MKKLMWIGLASLVIFTGCELVNRDFYLAEDDFPDQYRGTLVLVLDGSSIQTKTIVPSTITMDASTFDLSFIGPDTGGADDFDVTAHPSVAYAKNGLTPGPWSVAITAKNSESPADVVGAIGGDTDNTIEFEIFAGVVTVVDTIDILPIDGQGDFSLTLSWPPDFIDGTADVDAYLVPAAEKSAYETDPTPFVIADTDFTMTTTTATYGNAGSYGDALESTGYYFLFIMLKDNETQVLGIVESVRIIDGHETYGDIDLTVEAGGLSLAIDVNLHNPVDIVFDPPVTTPAPTLALIDSLPVTANLTYPSPPSDSYTYEWYVDGISTTVTGTPSGTPPAAAFTLLGGAYLGGNHHLSVLITGTTGGVITISAATFPFAVE